MSEIIFDMSLTVQIDYRILVDWLKLMHKSDIFIDRAKPTKQGTY